VGVPWLGSSRGSETSRSGVKSPGVDAGKRDDMAIASGSGELQNMVDEGNGLKSATNVSKHLCESSCNRSSGTHLQLICIVKRNRYRQIQMDSTTWCNPSHLSSLATTVSTQLNARSYPRDSPCATKYSIPKLTATSSTSYGSESRRNGDSQTVS
jgi:hypothetical protein